MRKTKEEVATLERGTIDPRSTRILISLRRIGYGVRPGHFVTRGGLKHWQRTIKPRQLAARG